MAVDMFLKIDGIKGESQNEKHKDEIFISSFSWGESQNVTRHDHASAGVGKVSMQDFHFTMETQSSSPDLFLACATGRHLQKVELSLYDVADRVPFLKIRLEDCIVSSFSVDSSGLDGGSSAPAPPAKSSGGDRPTESLSLNFSKISWTYTPQLADGSAALPITSGWDLVQNKKV